MTSVIQNVAGIEIIALDTSDDTTLLKHGFSFTPEEKKRILHLLGRNPTKVELHVFAVEWSEHCSYKSSKSVLKKYLKTDAPYVVVGPGEDAGVVEIGEGYCLVAKHESHNHPSQVLPVEGAATGIGGIVRDINCMGARVVGCFDPLRFGTKKSVRWIARGVVEGIWTYANALGVPNVGGDVYFAPCYDDNCLVNAGAIGIVKKDAIISSKAPGPDFDLIIVGKPTDWSGFGGVVFASEILNEDTREEKKGAVQIPDPFLKNVLFRANEQVISEAHAAGVQIAMKDLGGGGLATCSAEMTEHIGAEIDLSAVPTASTLPPEVIACAETQERYLLAVPPSFTHRVLTIYNNVWDLGSIYDGARAAVIGKTRGDRRYVLFHNRRVVADIPSSFVEPCVIRRKAKKRVLSYREPSLSLTPSQIRDALLRLLSSPNIASREAIYSFYDTEVQGNTVIRPGEADASVIRPLSHSSLGIAVGIGGNPFYGALSPYWGGVHAVVEAMRNVVAVGATPWALTDCLNFGNPEKPEAFWEFRESVKGIGDAARNVAIRGHAVPIIGGNVSFYNESAQGNAIYPSPTVACYGILRNYAKAITLGLKKEGNLLLLLGKRSRTLGGSELYRLFGEMGTRVPRISFDEERERQRAVIELIDKHIAVAAHDISDGGLAVALAEMMFASPFGVSLTATIPPSRLLSFLFSESSGFVLEIDRNKKEALSDIVPQGDAFIIGVVNGEETYQIGNHFSLDKASMVKAWKTSLEAYLTEA